VKNIDEEAFATGRGGVRGFESVEQTAGSRVQREPDPNRQRFGQVTERGPGGVRINGKREAGFEQTAAG
jgi:hypothetical protein